MKKYFCVTMAVMALCFNSCVPTSPDDPTRFSTKSIIGTWVCVDASNEISWYYDIKSDSHLLLVEKPKNSAGRAVYDPSDGCMHTTSNFKWNQTGDFIYEYDESKQLIRCLDGSYYGYPVVKTVIDELGSDEAFTTERVGLDEAYLHSKIKNRLVFGFIYFTMYDGHVFRIKGIKQDLQSNN